jgi:hypothetical protein
VSAIVSLVEHRPDNLVSDHSRFSAWLGGVLDLARKTWLGSLVKSVVFSS